MKRKTETPAYIPPNSAEITEQDRRKRIRNRVHVKQVVEEKQTKLIVNLNRCSQNWKTIAGTLPPKISFKRQQLKKSPKLLVVAEKLVTEDVLDEDEKKEIWFDVDKAFLPDAGDESVQITDEFREEKVVKITKAIAIDCEMVGVGEYGKDSILARVSLVNSAGECFYDKYVQPTEKVTDYRTAVSGVRPDDVKEENGAVLFSQAQKEVNTFFENRILVGHAIHNDLQTLLVSHPKKHIRDTQKCKLFRRMHKSIGSLVSLKNLVKLLLGVSIQSGEHSSVKDAQVTMRLYTTFRKEWEAELHNRQVKVNEEKAVERVESGEAVIEDGAYRKKAQVEILTGNETHKKYLQNKLRKRGGNRKKKMFLK